CSGPPQRGRHRRDTAPAARDGTLRAEDDGKLASAKSVQSYVVRAFGERVNVAAISLRRCSTTMRRAQRSTPPKPQTPKVKKPMNRAARFGGMRGSLIWGEYRLMHRPAIRACAGGHEQGTAARAIGREDTSEDVVVARSRFLA